MKKYLLTLSTIKYKDQEQCNMYKILVDDLEEAITIGEQLSHGLNFYIEYDNRENEQLKNKYCDECERKANYE